MTERAKMEFWNALARLYDDTLALREATQGLRLVAEAHQEAT